ncbi:unnamed protein product [Blepharisma stoltei]|uniref:Ribosomal eL28/Mak16 domain-containing protein n=1 Tax=Blepharisma stoltei TaxID=1481888 RepID=A0AAU9K693_9CILI|nr:unnamed protein product [Blepharisma stoltei]
MVSVSSDLLWELLRNNNKYLIRRQNTDFSTDPYNLVNIHSQKFAGIASTSAIGVATRKKGEPVTLKAKKLRKYGLKGKTHHEEKITVKKAGYSGKAKSTIVSLVENRNPSLAKAASERMQKLHRSEQPKKTITRRNRKA